MKDNRTQIRKFIFLYETEGHRLYQDHLVQDWPIEEREAAHIVLGELDWYRDLILHSGEKERDWGCHLAMEGILARFLSPAAADRLRHEFSRRLFDLQEIESPSEEDVRTAQLLTYAQNLVTRETVSFERQSLLRKIALEFLKRAVASDWMKTEMQEPADLFREHLLRGEETSYVSWVRGGCEGESPNPYSCGDEKLVIEILKSMEEGEFTIHLFSPDQLKAIFDRLTRRVRESVPLSLIGDEQKYPFLWQTLLKQETRIYLDQLRNSSRWGQIRATLWIAATNHQLSAEEEERKWAPHLRQWAKTLDHCYRGDHNILRIALTYALTEWASNSSDR